MNEETNEGVSEVDQRRPRTSSPIGRPGGGANMDRRQLAQRLREICGLRGHFVLRSGEVSDFYFDKYLFEAVPGLLWAVAELSSSLIPEGTDVLAGLELGGVPISTALSLLTGIPQVLVRKEAKTYGTAKLAEGPDIGGRRLTVIEDVITTGGQVVLSTEELRARGAVVDTVVCVVDRRPAGGGATDKLAEAGMNMRSLFTLDEILSAR